MKVKVIILGLLAILVFLVLEISDFEFLQTNKGIATTLDAVEQQKPVEQEDRDIKIPEPEKKKAEPLRITAAGDILLGRGVEFRLKRDGKDYIYPFEKIADILKKGDIIFGNLEEPLTDSVHGLVNIDKGGKYVLKNEAASFEGIKYAGFNLLNLANNHILDFYEEGLNDTIEVLDKNGIAHAGAGKNIDEARSPAIIERKNVKVGMLSYTDMSEVVYAGDPPLMFLAKENKAGVAPVYSDYRHIKEDIEKLRDKVDIVIVSLHWGIEESFEIPQSQRNYAYNLLDSGADIILGHHPHQFQGIEMYNGKPIVYSMGNLIFDQNDPENQESFILDIEYDKNKLTAFSMTPVRTVGKTQVVRPEGEDAAGLLEREIGLCRELGTSCHIKDDRIIFDID